MMQARAAGGQAAVVAHVAAHELGPAAYAIKVAGARWAPGATGRAARRHQMLDGGHVQRRGAPAGHLAGLAERPPACEDVGDLLARWEQTPGQDSK
jgi:hypothetical protein